MTIKRGRAPHKDQGARALAPQRADIKKPLSRSEFRGIQECPLCGVSLIGAEIPEHQRESYGGQKYFGRVIGIERRGDDRVSSWRCPDCCGYWAR